MCCVRARISQSDAVVPAVIFILYLVLLLVFLLAHGCCDCVRLADPLCGYRADGMVHFGRVGRALQLVLVRLLLVRLRARERLLCWWRHRTPLSHHSSFHSMIDRAHDALACVQLLAGVDRVSVHSSRSAVQGRKVLKYISVTVSVCHLQAWRRIHRMRSRLSSCAIHVDVGDKSKPGANVWRGVRSAMWMPERHEENRIAPKLDDGALAER